MDYEKKYNEALERANMIYNDKYKPEIAAFAKKSLETIFPELAESVDERIRKTLIAFHKSTIDIDGIKGSEFIAWLEKQGEQKPFDYEHANIQQKDFSPKSVMEAAKEEKIDNIYKDEPKFKIGYWICNGGGNPCKVNYIFGNYYELCSIEGYKYSKPIRDVDTNYRLWTIDDAQDGDVLVSKNNKPFIYNGNHDSFHIGSYCGITVEDKFEVATEKCHWTEKINIYPSTKEQRELLFAEMKEEGYEWYADKKKLKKIKSKFHEGDWIIHRGTENVYQVVACIDNQYQLRYGDNYTIQKCDEVDRNTRLWTIQDAKPGDVLAAHECYVMFREIDGLNIRCYCTYHYMNNPSFHVDTLQNKDAFHPATKEQRELLFKAIEENGYKWNDEEKHLLKGIDLEKEIEKYLLTNATLLVEGGSKLVVHHIAKHFFELGLKTQKGN